MESKMDKGELVELIKKGESETIEFSESFDRETIKTVGAFSNTKGGIIFIGLSDKDTIKGVQTDEQILKDWASQVYQNTEPHIIPEIEGAEIEGKSIGVIKVKESVVKPVVVKGRCFKRVGASNSLMTSQEVVQIRISSASANLDAFSTPSTDIDILGPQK